MGLVRRIASAAIAILLGLGAAGAASAAPALWVVKDADSEIYLFGTLHALDPATQWRTPLYDAAYARAQTVWFEADLDTADPLTVGGIVNRYGVDPERPLSRKLAAPDLQALGRQIDVRRIDHLRPWAVALMLSMQPMLGKGARVEAGADMTMTRVARTGGKRLKAFETLEDQARLFAGLSESAELQYLTGIIHERDAGPKFVFRPSAQNLEKAWVAGDMNRLGPALVGELRDDNPALYDALLTRRNLAWADQLTREMAGGGVELVNVGALHMVGDGGLPALMKARGFTVERLQ